MQATVRQVAEWVGGRVVGDGEVRIDDAHPLHEAGPGHVTFLESAKHLKALSRCRASAVIAPVGHEALGIPVIEADDPLEAFSEVFRRFHPPPAVAPPMPGIDPRSAVHPSATVGRGASIAPFAAIGEGTVIGARCRLHVGAVVGRNCRLGDDVTIYPHAVVYDSCVIGNRVIIHANAVIGSDGFGYRLKNGRHVKVPQAGRVEIGDDVEIGAGAAIDRGTFQATTIGEGTKIDNLVQIAHNCRIGRHNLIVSQVGIAGSSSTGDYVIIAGQVGVVDHCHIGDRAVVGAKAGVTKDVLAGQAVLGAPARPEREAKIMLLTLEKLPDMYRDLRKIKKQLGIE